MMMKHLTTRDREAIIGIIDGWPPETRFTWQRLIDRIGERLGIRPMRQTLARHAGIRLAYKIRKKGSPKVQPSSSERILREHVERLTAENIRLKHFYQMFAQWQYRVYLRGMTKKMLEEMKSERLPRIDRDRSD